MCLSDVLQGPVLGLLDPSEVCQLAACSKELLHLVRSRRAAILLARHRLRMCLRGRRAVLQQRAFFVSHECKVDELGEQQLLQHNILQQLQASPDGIRDLAAAVQQSLASVTTQTSVPPACLQHIQQDLVRMANFVCLVAWRLHLRSRRARRLRQQQQDFAALQAPGTAFAAAAYDDSDVVVVVINEDVAQQIQPADAALGPIQQEHHVQNEAEHVQGLLDPQQQHMMEVTLHVEQQQQLAIAAPAPSDAPLPAPARVSVSVQTDDLGPTMREVNELLSGLKALMQPGNLSMKPGRATLALLNHHIKLQLQAWNLQPQQQVVAQQW